MQRVTYAAPIGVHEIHDRPHAMLIILKPGAQMICVDNYQFCLEIAINFYPPRNHSFEKSVSMQTGLKDIGCGRSFSHLSQQWLLKIKPQRPGMA